MKQLPGEFHHFTSMLRRYSQKRLHQAWVWFEAKKNLLVGVLIARRGTYTRPFLHTSLFILVIVAIISAPIVKSTYETQTSELSQFMTPSAVLSSLDDQNTVTERSDRGRDTIIKYTVEDGDTLGSIAEKFGISIDTIKWANDLKNDALKPSQVLDILPVTGVAVKVRKGDTVYSLAKKYDSNAQQIVDFPVNDFSDLDTFALNAGQIIIIPDGSLPEPAPVVVPGSGIGNIARTKPITGQVGANPGTGQFIWPTQGGITQRFVYYHPGLDIANNAAPAIAAADSGTVVSVEYLKYDYGHHVIIDHGNGYQTLYAHMSTINVNAGAKVTKGQVIGKMGSTGRSTGTHLHFEIRKGGVHLNPLTFLK